MPTSSSSSSTNNTPGLMLVCAQPTSHNRAPSTSASITSGSTFTKIAFAHSAVGGDSDRFASVDRRGNVYLFNLRGNRYSVIQRTGKECTSLLFSSKRITELFVALKDASVQCYDADSGQLISTLRGHQKPIHNISLHPFAAQCLTCSSDAVLLWDLLGFKKLKTLSSETVGLTEAAYAPSSGKYIVTCLKNELYVWDSSSFEFVQRFSVPRHAIPLHSANDNSASPLLDISTFAISDDEKHLVAGGQSSCDFYLWDFASFTLVRSISLPSPSRGVVKFKFLPGAETLAILTTDGKVLFVQMGALKVEFEIKTNRAGIIDFDIDHSGALMACTLNDGSIHVYDLAAVRIAQLAQQQQQQYDSVAHAKASPFLLSTSQPISQDLRQQQQQQQRLAASVDSDQSQTATNVKRRAGTAAPAGTALSSMDSNCRSNSNTTAPRSDTNNDDEQIRKRGEIQDIIRLPPDVKAINSSEWTQSTCEYPRGAKMATSAAATALSSHNNNNNNIKTKLAGGINRGKTAKPSSQKKKKKKKNENGNEEHEEEQASGFKLNTELDETELFLNLDKLKNLLITHGEYPDKYRTLIWRFILCVPENREAFNNLMAKGTHFSLSNLSERYPLQDQTLFRRLEKVLSGLCHLSNVFASVDYLPEIVFPFVKIFKSDLISAFEVCYTFLTNWCQSWFEFHPHPPITVLNFAENLLSLHDEELLQHFKKNGITAEHYVWCMLSSIFTEVLTRREWLKLFDHVFTSQPVFLLHFLIAYLIHFRSILLCMNKAEDFEAFFHQNNHCQINDVIKRAYELQAQTVLDGLPSEYTSFQSLPPGPSPSYPAFNRYPRFIVDYELKQRQRIQLEEEHLLRSRRNAMELKNRVDALAKEEEDWFATQHKILEMEEQRRNEAWAQEQELLRERMRVEEMNREQRLRQIAIIEQNAHRFLEQQQKLRDAEWKRVQDEIARRNQREQLELKNLMEEEALKKVEAEANRRLQEMKMLRDTERHMSQVREEISAQQLQRELDAQMRKQTHQWEDEESALKRALAESKRDKLHELNEHMRIQMELLHSTKIKDLENNLMADKLEHERRMRQIAEEEFERRAEQIEQEKQRERILLKEQEQMYDRLLREQEKARRERADAREKILEREKRKNALEVEMRTKKLKELEMLQKQREYEESLNKLRREEEINALKEEKELQRVIMELEEERRKDKQLQQQIDLTKQELHDKLEYERRLQQLEEKVIEEERAKFSELREQVRKRLEAEERSALQRHEAQIRQMFAEKERYIKQMEDEIRRRVREEQERALSQEQEEIEERLRRKNQALLQKEMEIKQQIEREMQSAASFATPHVPPSATTADTSRPAPQQQQQRSNTSSPHGVTRGITERGSSSSSSRSRSSNGSNGSVASIDTFSNMILTGSDYEEFEEEGDDSLSLHRKQLLAPQQLHTQQQAQPRVQPLQQQQHARNTPSPPQQQQQPSTMRDERANANLRSRSDTPPAATATATVTATPMVRDTSTSPFPVPMSQANAVYEPTTGELNQQQQAQQIQPEYNAGGSTAGAPRKMQQSPQPPSPPQQQQQQQDQQQALNDRIYYEVQQHIQHQRQLQQQQQQWQQEQLLQQQQQQHFNVERYIDHFNREAMASRRQQDQQHQQQQHQQQQPLQVPLLNRTAAISAAAIQPQRQQQQQTQTVAMPAPAPASTKNAAAGTKPKTSGSKKGKQPAHSTRRPTPTPMPTPPAPSSSVSLSPSSESFLSLDSPSSSSSTSSPSATASLHSRETKEAVRRGLILKQQRLREQEHQCELAELKRKQEAELEDRRRSKQDQQRRSQLELEMAREQRIHELEAQRVKLMQYQREHMELQEEWTRRHDERREQQQLATTTATTAAAAAAGAAGSGEARQAHTFFYEQIYAAQKQTQPQQPQQQEQQQRVSHIVRSYDIPPSPTTSTSSVSSPNTFSFSVTSFDGEDDGDVASHNSSSSSSTSASMTKVNRNYLLNNNNNNNNNNLAAGRSPTCLSMLNITDDDEEESMTSASASTSASDDEDDGAAITSSNFQYYSHQIMRPPSQPQPQQAPQLLPTTATATIRTYSTSPLSFCSSSSSSSMLTSSPTTTTTATVEEDECQQQPRQSFINNDNDDDKFASKYLISADQQSASLASSSSSSSSSSASSGSPPSSSTSSSCCSICRGGVRRLATDACSRHTATMTAPICSACGSPAVAPPSPSLSSASSATTALSTPPSIKNRNNPASDTNMMYTPATVTSMYTLSPDSVSSYASSRAASPPLSSASAMHQRQQQQQQQQPKLASHHLIQDNDNDNDGEYDSLLGSSSSPNHGNNGNSILSSSFFSSPTGSAGGRNSSNASIGGISSSNGSISSPEQIQSYLHSLRKTASDIVENATALRKRATSTATKSLPAMTTTATTTATPVVTAVTPMPSAVTTGVAGTTTATATNDNITAVVSEEADVSVSFCISAASDGHGGCNGRNGGDDSYSEFSLVSPTSTSLLSVSSASSFASSPRQQFY